MKAAIAAILCAPALMSAQAGPDLAALYEAHQFFAYRDAVQSMKNPPELARGIVACVFNDIPHCEQRMQHLVRSKGVSEADQSIALGRLGGLFAMHGRYPSFYRMLLSQAPEVESMQDGLVVLMRTWARFPEMSVFGFHPSSLKCDPASGEIRLPVLINGVSGSYKLDTGAGTSVISEDEARRVHMRLVDVPRYEISGFTGAKAIVTKIGVADQVQLGGIRLANVPFMIADDPTSDPGQGNLGRPVVLACQTIRWDADGTVRLGYPSAGRRNLRLSNLYLDDALYAQAEFRGRKMEFEVDSGGQSYLLEPFRKAFPELARESGEKGKWTVTGLGARDAELDATILPEIELKLGQGSAVLNPARILSLPGRGFGLLAPDGFERARAVTLDFRRMLLTVE